MLKVYASIASVGLLVALTGCSSADTPDTGTGGTPSTTGGQTSSAGTATTTGGTPAGTGGTPSTSGGMASTAGAATGGTPAGGAATGGTATGGTATGGSSTGGAATGAECKGIKTNMACTVEGVNCPNLACGLADSGVRNCSCMTTWMCTACDFTNSPFKDKPADAPNCTAGVEADKVACPGKDGQVCLNAAGGEVCACAADDEGALIWDCDKPPSTWAAAAM